MTNGDMKISFKTKVKSRPTVNTYWNEPALISCQTIEWSGLARTLSQKNGFNLVLGASDSSESSLVSPVEVRRWWGPRGEGFAGIGGLGGRRPTLGGGGGAGAAGFGGGGGGPGGGGGGGSAAAAAAVLPGGSGKAIFPSVSAWASVDWDSASEESQLASNELPTVEGDLKSLLHGLPMVWDFSEEPE